MRALVLALLVVGCDAPGPPTIEIVHTDARARVLLELVDLGGFPDRVARYRVIVERGARRDVVLSGERQIQSVRGQVSVARLPGTLALALGTEVCADLACADLEDTDPPPSLREALAWRARDHVDLRHRARAAIGLARIDPDAALPILDGMVGEPYAGDDSLDPEVRGVRARLRGDRAEIAALRARIPGATGSWLAGLARACVPALESALRAELAARPPSVIALVTGAAARCAR